MKRIEGPGSSTGGDRTVPRLARAITVAMIVKVLLLALLWIGFVRGQVVAVDARDTAEAFGLGQFRGDGRGH